MKMPRTTKGRAGFINDASGQLEAQFAFRWNDVVVEWCEAPHASVESVSLGFCFVDVIE